MAAENVKERVHRQDPFKGGNLSRTEPLVIRVTSGEQTSCPRPSRPIEMMPLLRRGSFGGRLTNASKQALLDAYGGTPESEAAVMRALRWLANHQQADGSWKLKEYDQGIQGCDCRNEKAEEKVLDIDVAGTAFGVLPFLGAGVGLDRCPENPPELAGEYMKRVKAAIGFLVKNQSHHPRTRWSTAGSISTCTPTPWQCAVRGLWTGYRGVQERRIRPRRPSVHRPNAAQGGRVALQPAAAGRHVGRGLAVPGHPQRSTGRHGH